MRLNKTSGFTIVELLVVIVVIGILAAFSLVSYSGISKQANVASIKSDLSSSARLLKVFNTDNGYYPEFVSTTCASDTATTKCLKLSGGNTIDHYSRPTLQTFILRIKKDSILYQVTDDTAPVVPPIFATGGTITQSGETRTHTFGTSCTSGSPCTITAIMDGTVTTSILGAGGGGGGGASDGNNMVYSGISGGNSSVLHVANNATYVANGGGGGGPGVAPGDFCDAGASGSAGGYQGLGSADLTSWTKLSGSGASGGAGGSGGSVCAPGGSGGVGGRLSGLLTVSASQQLTIVVGTGGVGGTGTVNGVPGSSGSVTISYPG